MRVYARKLTVPELFEILHLLANRTPFCGGRGHVTRVHGAAAARRRQQQRAAAEALGEQRTTQHTVCNDITV